MFYVYVLFSQLDEKFYIGYSQDVYTRFSQHCNGEVQSTANRRPLKLIYFEAHVSKEDSLRRENYFKRTAGKRTFKLMLRESIQDMT